MKKKGEPWKKPCVCGHNKGAHSSRDPMPCLMYDENDQKCVCNAYCGGEIVANLEDVREELNAKLQEVEALLTSRLNPRHANAARALQLLAEARSNVQAMTADDGAGNGALPD